MYDSSLGYRLLWITKGLSGLKTLLLLFSSLYYFTAEYQKRYNLENRAAIPYLLNKFSTATKNMFWLIQNECGSKYRCIGRKSCFRNGCFTWYRKWYSIHSRSFISGCFSFLTQFVVTINLFANYNIISDRTALDDVKLTFKLFSSVNVCPSSFSWNLRSSQEFFCHVVF